MRRCPNGDFGGLAAGLAYSTPARTYYRDGYWTLQLLLRLGAAGESAPRTRSTSWPSRSRRTARAPSGVIMEGPHALAFEAYRLAEPALAAVHWRPGEWWSDHFDSPLFMILAVSDYVAATSDDQLARRHWAKLLAVFHRYLAAGGRTVWPVKPRNDRDWADNTSTARAWSSYDLGLWVGAALDVLAFGSAPRSIPPSPPRPAARAAPPPAPPSIALRRDGVMVDYLPSDGWVEPHLALDVMTLLGGSAPSRTSGRW